MRLGLGLSALVAAAGCASGGGAAKTPSTPASPPAAASTASGDPAAVARGFWVAIAGHDAARAAALASFPFDLDAHEGCVESETELRDLLAKVPPEMRIEIGAVREVSRDRPGEKPAAWGEDNWRLGLAHFTSADAKCLGAAGAPAGQSYRYYFVDFSVAGEAVGSLTRLRCRGASCAVAGTDN